MNNAITKNVSLMDERIQSALTDCSRSMTDDCTSLDESFEAMTSMIEVLSEHHCRAIWAVIGSTLEMNKQGILDIPNSALRDMVNNCITAYQETLTEGVVSSCKDEGYPNILDPNEAVREEALNDNL